jgi:hypothetical protein
MIENLIAVDYMSMGFASNFLRELMSLCCGIILIDSLLAM